MKKITLVVLSLPFLSACSPSMLELPEMPEMPEMPSTSMSKLIPDISLPTLFRSDINQGSILDRFSINQLKVGMTKAEVQDLIGSPSVTDPFHNNQWDYINHSTLYKKDNINYRLTLIFDKNALKNIDTSKLESLPPLTEKEIELEGKRLAEEKIIAERAAKEKAEQAKSKAKSRAMAIKKAAAQAKASKEKQAAQAKVAAKAKAIADKKAEDEVKALAEKRAANKKALEKKQAAEAKVATREADLKEGYEAYEKAAERAKSLKGLNTPWYRFW